MVLSDGQASCYKKLCLRILFKQFSYVLTALGRCVMYYATGIYDKNLRLVCRVCGSQTKVFQNLSELLAIVLVDFTPKRINSVSCHKAAILAKRINTIQVFLAKSTY